MFLPGFISSPKRRVYHLLENNSNSRMKKIALKQFQVAYVRFTMFPFKRLSDLKFGGCDGPNLRRVKKGMLVPHLLKIYFGLG